MSMPLRERRSGVVATRPWTERLLHGLGAHPAFADAVLGDLAEERARRQAREGTLVAHCWYAREALRSAPHLLWNAVRHGSARGRARVAAVLLAVALVPTVALVAYILRDGPPARLVVEGQRGRDVSDGIVLNTRHPVQLAMRVLDAEGHALSSGDVRYQWMSGTPLPVSRSGVVTCRRSGDATVRASIGTVATTVLLRCRPVTAIGGDGLIELVAGGSGRELTFAGFGPDGRQVTLLAGELRVQDSSIATLKGGHIHPVAVGNTMLTVRVGDAKAQMRVSVFQPVRTLEGLRPGQRQVVAPLRLAAGDTIRWPLPRGLFWLRYDPASDAQARPAFAMDGPIVCMPYFGPASDLAGCVVRGPGASVRITRPPWATGEIAGGLWLEMRDP